MTYHDIDAAMNHIPGLRTQGQVQALALALKAFDLLTTATVAEQPTAEEYEALHKAMEALRVASKLARQAEVAPEAVTTVSVTPHVPEEIIYQELCTELTGITDKTHFVAWYTANRSRFELVQSTSRRNKLFDLIREKKHTLCT